MTRILVVLSFLTLGIHLQRDLPAILAQLAQVRQNVEIRIAPPLDGHPALDTSPARPRPIGVYGLEIKGLAVFLKAAVFLDLTITH